jgi:regulator of protease activity HflC (stomatin/prohibitin superfamily)
MENTIKLKSNGFFHTLLGILFILSPLALIVYTIVWLIPILACLSLLGIIWLCGLMIVEPNQSKVLLFFGKYKGTVKENGFYWVNPFYSKQKVSLRARNLESDVIKVNDEQGNPILISAVIVWKVVDTYKAVFDIETMEEVDATTGQKKSKPEESYKAFVKIQAESALRKIAHTYPYDDIDSETKSISLRSGGDEINIALAAELKERLMLVGIEIHEARISNLAYAPEIASSMLQRQQAQAVISARKKIVEGAVGMVEMAVAQLEEKKIVEFTADKKASMVSNLLVVLCSDNPVNPVVDTGR